MKPKSTLRSFLAAGSSLLAIPSAQAQTAWDGGGGDTDYSNLLNWAGDIIPGNGNNNGANIGNALTHTVVYNTDTSYTSTGTGKANSLLVGTGTSGVGSLTLSGSAGTLTFGGDSYNNAAWIGTTSGAVATTGTVTVSAGKLAIGTGAGSDASINLGVSIDNSAGAKSGTLLINGGTVEVGRRLLMGANNINTVGLLTISSGTLDMKRTGLNGEGDLGMIRFGTGINTVNLDGGTAIMTAFHVQNAVIAGSTINFNGTTLKANLDNADFTSVLGNTTTNVNLRLKTGGLVLDTNGFNIGISDPLTQETGHTAILRKEGAGTLTLKGTSNHTGTTAVNGGTLRISDNSRLSSAGATTVSGSSSILDLDGNDTWGNSAQALTIESGGLVTNGTLTTRGFNAVQTLALNGGELRVTGTARVFTDGGLFKFEAYGIRNTVTVTGTTASSITNPSAIANAGINIGTDLGGGVGSNLTFNVADVTSSSAADLTVSAVLKNNYTASTPYPSLANGLVKTGVGTVVLSAVNRYTGDTTVDLGTLSIVEPYLADASDVALGNTATLDLQFAVTDTVDKLFINGVQQADGTWGAEGNMAADHTSPRITGSGLLDVTTGPPPPAGYAGWASGFLPAFTNNAADLDFENDGLASGIEWVVGGNPTLNDAVSVAPTFNNTTDPADFLFTFRRRDTAATDLNTTIVVQYGSDLAGWTTAQDGVNGVSINDTTDLGGGFHQVTVAIPRTLAGGSGKLFARLRIAVVTP